ncbi:MAG: annexin, partial [Candidatus Eremiobacterota bacterium]
APTERRGETREGGQTTEPGQPPVDVNACTQDAVRLHEAIAGAGTTESVLNEILSNRSNAEINEIKAAYQRMYGVSLEDDIKGDTSGDYEDMLVELLKANRDESGQVNQAQATQDAVRLHEAIAGAGTTESVLNEILSRRSRRQIDAIAAAYQNMFGESLEDAIRGDTGGDYEDLLVAQLNRRDTARRQ